MAHTKEYTLNGVHIHEIDARHLEDGLRLTAEHLRDEQDVVILLTHYRELRHTHHWIDYQLLGEILGIRVGLQEDLPMLLEMPHEGRGHAIHDIDAFVAGAVRETLHHAPNDYGDTFTQKADYFLTNRWIGFPVLGIVLYLVFELTFLLGDPMGEWLDEMVTRLYGYLYQVLPSGWFVSLLADGVVMGVGSLLTALPNIAILFLFLSLMEESGYMARVSYLMDRVMHVMGLHGRSFVPMLMGFDCNVPAIMAARDIRDPKERMLTMLMIPFMSCSARLPVYILFIDAFFPNHKVGMLGGLYLMGILCAFGMAMVLKNTPWFRAPQDDHVTELPGYQVPTLEAVCSHVWERVADFIRKVTTIVLGASIVIWALEFFPAGDLQHIEQSWLAMIGQAMEPLMRPLGFDWRLTVCLMTGVPAKEAIAATFAILFGNDISTVYLTSAGACAFLIFTLLYFPCISTIATIRREINGRWAAFTVVNSLLLAWVMAFIINQLGTLWLG